MKELRPPVVVVVGHVDHGKTSLLDYIRKTSVTKKEAGGITQSIGASVVTFTSEAGQNKSICFIDTPGHALFGSMRSRGITLADIAVLVVSADDGVKPQTREAIKLLQDSRIPFIVAITKIDLATANIENVISELEKEGVYFEKRGGQVSYVGVSNKTGAGIPELLDLISLLSEFNDIKGSADDALDGFVIETAKDKKGLLVSSVIKGGKIKIGDTIFANSLEAKVKGLLDDNQKPIKEVLAGYPAQILGFDKLPEVGSKISSAPNPETMKQSDHSEVSSDANIKIFIKAKTSGSLEALLSNIPDNVQIIGSGVGDVIESDIFLSKAANADIFLFESKFSSIIRKLAETESIKIERFDVVYDLIKKLEDLVNKGKEEVLGSAQIIDIFPFNGRKVAGCKILQGVIKKADKLKLIRNNKILGQVRIVSIRKQKEEVILVKQGEECGILFEPHLDFGKGDVLLSVTNN